MKIKRTNKSGKGSIVPTTAVQPSNGGIEPANPPITIFKTPENFKILV